MSDVQLTSIPLCAITITVFHPTSAPFSRQDKLPNHAFYLKIHIQFTNTFDQLAIMVQGLPAIDWKKPENNAKLFAAVLASIPGTPNYKTIAAAFGESALIVVSFLHHRELC